MNVVFRVAMVGDEEDSGVSISCYRIQLVDSRPGGRWTVYSR